MNNPGMAPAVQQSLQGKMDIPQLSQVSPQAPMQGQVPQPQNPSSLSPMPQPTASEDVMLVLKALTDYIKVNPRMGGGGQRVNIPTMLR